MPTKPYLLKTENDIRRALFTSAFLFMRDF